MKAAHIEDGKVVNVILVDSLDVFPELTLVALGDNDPVQPGDLWDGKKFTTPGPTPKQSRDELMAKVDDAVEAKISKSTRFAIGYQQREAAATAYKAAGYTGDPSEWISRFADNVGMPYRNAADLILSQADALRAALKELEAFRMDKYKIKSAATYADALASYDATILAIAEVVIP